MMHNDFRFFCAHPYGYPLSEFDALALENGCSLIIDSTDETALSCRITLNTLMTKHPRSIFIRCRSGGEGSFLKQGFSIITSYPDSASVSDSGNRQEVIAECCSPDEAAEASNRNISGILLRGSEAGGIAGELNNFVFLQAAAPVTDLPLYMEGGIGKYAIGGLFAAGAAGAVLNEQTFLFIESPLSECARDVLLRLVPDETCSVVRSGRSFRFHRKVHSPAVDAFIRYIDREGPEIGHVQDYVRSSSASCFEEAGNDQKLFPLGTDALFAVRFMHEFACFSGFSRHMRRYLQNIRRELGRGSVFSENSRFAVSHGIRYPLFQGPMVNITDSPEFADAVSDAGAMPFLALGTLPDRISKKVIRDYREKSGRKVLGLGLMGMAGIMDSEGFTKTDTVTDASPDYVILGGGEAGYAQKLERAGITVYFHTPAPVLFKQAVSRGITHVILEGSEAGGHISSYTSFTLWQNILYMIEQDTDMPNSMHVVFAGGISTRAGVRFLAGMCACFGDKGPEFGLQAGTVFLTSHEITETGSLDPEYGRKIRNGKRTAVVAGRIGRPQRMLPSPKTDSISAWEKNGIREGRNRSEMKREFEELVNRGALRMASRREVFNSGSLTDESAPSFIPCNDEETYEKEAGFLCGQNICVFDRTLSCREIVEELFVHSEKELHSFLNAGFSENGKRNNNPYSGSIAVVGIGSRFPEAQNTGEYWENIINGKNSIQEVPLNRWDPRFYWDPDRNAPNKTYSKIGSFTDLSDFNPLDFGILPNALPHIPGAQKIGLLCVKEAVEHTGLPDMGIPFDRIGVFMGTSVCAGGISDYSVQVDKDRLINTLSEGSLFKGADSKARKKALDEFGSLLHDPEHAVNEDSNPEILSNIVAGRIANAFNFTGPNYTADAACASSPAAVLNAVRALQAGQVDAAVAGGADFSNDPLSYVTFSKVGALSPHMSCPFDERADGFVMGEGGGVLILKRLEDAERDGDRIYAVIKGIGSSSDGSGKGITAPNPEGQMKALKNAYLDARVAPDTVGLYEAHGTSTPAGDAAEFRAASAFFRRHTAGRNCIPMGSVKSQIGHIKAAAGIAGLIKCILALHTRILPPTINVKKVNPAFNIQESPFTIHTACSPWESDGNPRRAACSSMGFGGTNFHVILEEYTGGAEYGAESRIGNAGLFVLNRTEDEHLEKTAETELQEIEKRVNIKPYAANSLLKAEREQAFAVPFGNKRELIDNLSNIRSLQSSKSVRGEERNTTLHSPDICFLFPGQGSQFMGMGLEIPRMFPETAELIHRADEICMQELGLPISNVIAGTSGLDEDPKEVLKNTLYCQPAVYLVSCMCSAALKRLGIKPDICIGHSLGEFSALACSGIISFEQGLQTVIRRARAMMSVDNEDNGAMAALITDVDTASDIISRTEGYAVIANRNSPGQNVISGSSQGVAEAVELCREQGIKAVKLNVSHGFHSDMVADAQEQFRSFLKTADFRKGTCRVISNVDCGVYPETEENTEWCVENLSRHIVSPVCFTGQVDKACEEGCALFIVAGPGTVLSRLVREITDEKAVCIDTAVRSQTLYCSIADCINTGIDIDMREAARAVKTWVRPCIDISDLSEPDEAVPFENTYDKDTVRYADTLPDDNEKAGPVMPDSGVTSDKGASSMSTTEKRNVSGIEEFILSLDDPVLSHMLYSPEFREFLNREKTGIRMLARQSLLDMFSRYSGGPVSQLPDISLPPRRESVVPEEPVQKETEKTEPDTSDEVYDISKFRQHLEPEQPAAPEIEKVNKRMEIAAADESPAEENKSEGTDMKGLLLDIIREKTGYTSDMIDPDAEFESELRIDSIKQTEIIGMFSEQAGIPIDVSRSIELETVTLNSILNNVSDLVGK